jgi:hypothetical protein
LLLVVGNFGVPVLDSCRFSGAAFVIFLANFENFMRALNLRFRAFDLDSDFTLESLNKGLPISDELGLKSNLLVLSAFFTFGAHF